MSKYEWKQLTIGAFGGFVLALFACWLGWWLGGHL